MKLRIFLSCCLMHTQTIADGRIGFDPERFHEQHCTGCHDTTLYTRPNRRVNSLDRLKSQVRFCSTHLGIQLFDDELEALVDHLNRHYYRLDP